MGVNTQTPPHVESRTLREYQTMVTHNGFTASDLPPLLPGNETFKVSELSGWLGYYHKRADGTSLVAVSGQDITLGPQSGFHAHLVPAHPDRKFKVRQLMGNPNQSSQPGLTEIQNLALLSHDDLQPWRVNQLVSPGFEFIWSGSGSITIPSADAFEDSQGGGVSGPIVMFNIFQASGNVGQIIVNRSAPVENQPYLGPGNKITISVSNGANSTAQVEYFDHPQPFILNYAITSNKFVVDTYEHVIPRQPTGFVISLGGMSTDSGPLAVDKTFNFSNYALETESPKIKAGQTIVLESCSENSDVASSVGSFDTTSSTEAEVIFESQRIDLHSGIWTLSFGFTGDLPLVEYVNRFGEVIEVNDDQDGTLYDTGSLAGYYFKTAPQIPQNQAGVLPQQLELNNEGGSLRLSSASGKTGTIFDVQVERYQDYVTQFVYGQYQAAGLEPRHIDDEYEWLFLTGVAFTIPAIKEGLFAVQQPPFSTGWLTVDTSSGDLSGTPNFPESGVLFGCRYRVVTRLSYGRNDSLTIDLERPAADGSVGNLSPEYTGGFETFTASFHSGDLPSDFQIEPDTGRIFHDGNGVSQYEDNNYELTLKITTDEGDFISPTYNVGFFRSLRPFIQYPNFTNDPTGFRDGQIYWDTQFPVGEVLPTEISGIYGQPATYAISSGSLPAGLTLDPQTGKVSGTFQPGQQTESGQMDVLVTNYHGKTHDNKFIFYWEVVAN